MSSRQGDGWSGEIGGNCPVQGDGLVDGKPWYFRARGTAWSFEVADDPLCPDANWVSAFGEPGIEFEQDYDGGDAGWMEDAVAWGLIEAAIARFRVEGGSRRQPDGIGQLLRCLQFTPGALDDWMERWSTEAPDPVAAAWSKSTYGSMMSGLLDLMAEKGLAPGHPRCCDCPPPLSEVRTESLATHQREVSDHFRQVVPNLPPLAELLRLKKTEP